MKRIFLLAIIGTLFITGCKKKHTDISQLVTVSYPTVTVTSGQYFSFPVNGGPLPSANTIVATAYDSFYREKPEVIVDASQVTSTIPGLYTITLTAKNSKGFVGHSYIYVAITDANDATDLSGLYLRNADGTRPANVVRVAHGLYRTDNLAGVNPSDPTQAGFVVAAFFAVTTDTTIDFGLQNTALGYFTTQDNKVIIDATGTEIQYSIHDNSNFGSAVRSFKKVP